MMKHQKLAELKRKLTGTLFTINLEQQMKVKNIGGRINLPRDFECTKRSYSTLPKMESNVSQSCVRQTKEERKRVTLPSLMKKYKLGEPITMMTAYDFPSARIVDESEMDLILVGDSVGMVSLGYSNTVPVTMEDMIMHCKAVSRGSSYAFKIGDMPFGSYEVSGQEAVRNAIRLMKEGAMDGIKLEGGQRVEDQVRSIVKAGIPCMGHIGLTPQTISSLGGFRAQGKTHKSASRLVDDALCLQDAGCFAIVIESVPDNVASFITDKLKVPTIGIGAGKYTSGQVLVFHDVLGIYEHPPKFCKKYLNGKELMLQAMRNFRSDILSGSFPAVEHSTSPMKESEYELFLSSMKQKFKISDNSKDL